MPEWIGLLLPLGMVAGWLIGRRGRVVRPKGEDGCFDTRYFQGLNYVLNEQPDKAIEVFIKMVEVDSDTVETHFALGSLFRRRGEVDRAIRLHQNLIARPNLDRNQRAQALLELGRDYMLAGLFDRAENLFRELVEARFHMRQAYENLVAIYEQEKDWDNAIKAARNLEGRVPRNMRPVIAQYHCEKAELESRAGRTGNAVTLLEQALGADPGSVRASLMLGGLESALGNWKVAIKAYLRVVEQDIDYVPEVIGPLRECYRRADNSEGMRTFLESVISRYDGVSPVLAMADLILERDGERAAAEYIAELSRTRPSVRGIDRYIDLRLPTSTGEARENLGVLRQLTQGLLESRPTYRCWNCGFQAKSLHWNCPGCKHWGSIKPIRGVQAE